MITTLGVVIVLGIVIVLLSWENDRLHQAFLETKKTEEDNTYKLSVIKEIQEKIAYTTDPEKVVNIIMIYLRNFFNYSVAASMVVKDEKIVFKTYSEEAVGPDYLKKVEESMLSSFEKLVGKLPVKIERETCGMPIDEAIKSIYSSSFHLPLIANNKVLALIHLSSTAQNAYANMDDLHALIDAAQSALTHFGQAVARENKKFLSLINSLNDGIFMLDNKDNLLQINPQAKRILGVTDNDNFADILKVFPQNFNLKDKINEVLLNKNPYSEKELQVGSQAINIFINPVGQDKVSVELHDMTDYRKKELLKEDLINIMVHELRSPITTIKDSSELLLTADDKPKTGDKLNFLEIIHHQAKKVLGQIGSILDAAKLDAGKLVLQKTKGDIERLIKDEIQIFMPQAKRKNISLDFVALTRSVPLFAFDEIRISQVIDNILSNSLKFTPENGKIKVELDYRLIPPVLNPTSPTGKFFSLDKFVVVSVSDNGVGITPEQQKFLFSKYTQAQNTSEEVATRGTGLGLYLVKGIVESHDGRVWVKSAPGFGTTFFFALPATDAAKPSHDAPKPSTTPLSAEALAKAGLSKLSQTVN